LAKKGVSSSLFPVGDAQQMIITGSAVPDRWCHSSPCTSTAHGYEQWNLSPHPSCLRNEALTLLGKCELDHDFAWSAPAPRADDQQAERHGRPDVIMGRGPAWHAGRILTILKPPPPIAARLRMCSLSGYRVKGRGAATRRKVDRESTSSVILCRLRAGAFDGRLQFPRRSDELVQWHTCLAPVMPAGTEPGEINSRGSAGADQQRVVPQASCEGVEEVRLMAGGVLVHHDV